MATDASGCCKPSLQRISPEDLTTEFLKEITDGFSGERKLGEGAFGTVYKGFLQDGQAIAVKKLSDNSPTTDKQFRNEVGNLGAIQHENVVGLYGYCYERRRL